MAYASSFPQRVPYSTNAEVVRFAPVQDSETGDDMLEPPFVRVRDGNTAYMYVDTSLSTQFNPSSNTASWVVGAAAPGENSHIFAHKVKRQAIVAAKYMYATPNVNPTNNTIKFRTNANPLLEYTITVPTYNYMRMITSPATPFISGPPLAYTTVAEPIPPGVSNAYGNEVDPQDGILTKIVAEMNTAIGGPPLFTVVVGDGYRDFATSNYNNTNTLFWRIGISAGSFIFTGGSMFTRGNYLLGVRPIVPVDFTNPANYYAVYDGGPVSYLYTRWIDITSRALMQNAKMTVSGTDVPPNLVLRIYLNKDDQRSGTRFIEINNTPLQWVNWFRSQTINAIDLQMRDEFGELLELPLRSNNVSWLSLVILNEL